MSSQLQMINRIIKQQGTNGYSLRKVTSTTPDPLNPSQGPGETVVDHQLWSFPDTSRAFQANNTLIQQGDILLYVDPTDLTIDIEVQDRVVHTGGDIWRIVGSGTGEEVGIQTYSLSDEVVLYAVQIRK